MIISYIICTSAWRSVWLDLLVYFCCYLLIINLLSLQDISHEIWYFFWTNLVFSLSWMMGGAGDHDKKIWSSPQSSILSSKSKSVMTKDCLLVKSHLRMAYIHYVQIYISLSCYQSLWVNKGKWKYKSSKVHCLMARQLSFCHHNEHFFYWDFWDTRFDINFWNSLNSKDTQMQPMWVCFRKR